MLAREASSRMLWTWSVALHCMAPGGSNYPIVEMVGNAFELGCESGHK